MPHQDVNHATLGSLSWILSHVRWHHHAAENRSINRLELAIIQDEKCLHVYAANNIITNAYNRLARLSNIAAYS